MSQSVADLPAETLDSYLDAPVESSPDAAPVEELQTTPDGLNEEQSSSPDEQVAPDTGTEQPEPEVAESADAPEVAAASAPNWDSPENPYAEQAKAWQATVQLAEQKQREAEEAAWRDSMSKAFQSLSEADESDLPALTGSLLEDVQQHAIAPVEQARQELARAMTATIAAMETHLTPAQFEAIRRETGEYLQRGKSAAEIENTHLVSKEVRSKMESAIAERDTRIKNLTAQLAAKTVQPSNRAETTVHSDTAATNFDGLSEDEQWNRLLNG